MSVEAFQIALHRRMRSALVRKQSYVEINAGDLHQEVREEVGDADVMPICCGVLKAEMCPADQIVHEPPQGRGPALTIRFVIPRV